MCNALSYFDGGRLFNILKRRNKTLKRINESLKKENGALKQELSLYDLDKLNGQLELCKGAYQEYRKLNDELYGLKMEYKKLIREVECMKIL